MWKLFQNKPSVRSQPARPRKPLLECLEDRTVPAVIHVGATESIQTLAQAAAIAKSGDDIQIDAGTYTGLSNIGITWTQSNLTIEGVGGSVYLNATGLSIPNRKGIFVIDGANATVKNIEFYGAHDAAGNDKNWAGIRGEGNTLTIENCSFFNNDDGILINNDPNAMTDNNDVTVVSSEFGYNGFGDGQSHNMYIGEVSSFTLEYSYSHDAEGGHLVKSRALTTNLLYNYLADTTSQPDSPIGVTYPPADGSAEYGAGSSTEIDIPYGGTSNVIGNIIEKDALASNSNFLGYNLENSLNAPAPLTYAQQLNVVNNTFVNDLGHGTFVLGNASAPPSSLLLQNNLFAGAGTLSSLAFTNVTNLQTNSPGFVSWSPGSVGGNYNLAAGSPAINAGTQPSAARTPTMQYVPVTSSQARPVAGALDIGAYEFAAVLPPTAPSSLKATDVSTSQINLTWTDNATNETGFQIDRATDSNFTHITKTWTVGANVTSASDTGLSAGTTYYYRVRAVNAAGNSANSNTATTMTRTAAPTGLTASAGVGKVTLTWKAPAGAATYDIYRSTTSGGEGAVPYRTGVTGTSFIDTGVTSGTTYYYEISAVNAGGESARTGQVTATAQHSLVRGVDAGGAAVAPFLADAYFSGGAAGTTTHAITTTGMPNVAPQKVYQSWRSGSTFTYTLTKLTPGATYVIQLDFADSTSTAAGQNVFNVALNGTAALSNFDIFAAAGGEYKPVAKQFTAKANSAGQVVIKFTAVKGTARVNGIEVYG